MSAETTLALLAEVPFFAALSSSHLAKLADRLTLRNYEPGTPIFNKDDHGSTLFIIRNGQVKISAPSPEGEEVVLAMMRDGDFFGELSILDLKPRSADATAVEATSVYTLAREDFLDVVRTEPGLAIDILAALGARLRRSNLLLQDAFFLDLPTRLVKRLLELAKQYGRKAEWGLKIDMSVMMQDNLTSVVDDLAGVIGASRKSVNKVLHDLQALELIFIRKKNIYIIRPDDLRQRAEEGLIQRPIRGSARGPGQNAALAMMFGLGVFIFALGLGTGSLSVAHAFVALVGTWTIAFVLWAFWGPRKREYSSDREPGW
jgi:CRP/FNR family cyclic AMP-dependent transcriptional regulator